MIKMTENQKESIIEDFKKIAKSKNLDFDFKNFSDSVHITAIGNEIEILRLVAKYRYCFKEESKVWFDYIKEIDVYNFTLAIPNFYI